MVLVDLPEFETQFFFFCLMAFAQRDVFKHLEARWHQFLPPTDSSYCTKVELAPIYLGKRSFAKLQPLHKGHHYVGSHVIILKEQRSCFENEMGYHHIVMMTFGTLSFT